MTLSKINESLSNIFSKISGVPTDEGVNLSKLLSVFFNQSKDLNPREIMRELSDPLIEHVIIERNNIPSDRMMKMIFQLFLIEWYYRNGYLLDDWIWRWDEHGKNGSVDLNPRIPLNIIPLPTAA